MHVAVQTDKHASFSTELETSTIPQLYGDSFRQQMVSHIGQCDSRLVGQLTRAHAWQVGAPTDPEQDGDGFSPAGSSFSPSPSPRGLLPEGSFVDESGRLCGGGGSSPVGGLGAPRLDARLVAVFSPRSMPSRAGTAPQVTPLSSLTLPQCFTSEWFVALRTLPSWCCTQTLILYVWHHSATLRQLQYSPLHSDRGIMKACLSGGYARQLCQH